MFWKNCNHKIDYIFSNPNEPQDQDMLHKQEHGRFKNIEWTAYETVHKKYLSLGTLADKIPGIIIPTENGWSLNLQSILIDYNLKFIVNHDRKMFKTIHNGVN